MWVTSRFLVWDLKSPAKTTVLLRDCMKLQVTLLVLKGEWGAGSLQLSLSDPRIEWLEWYQCFHSSAFSTSRSTGLGETSVKLDASVLFLWQSCLDVQGTCNRAALRKPSNQQPHVFAPCVSVRAYLLILRSLTQQAQARAQPQQLHQLQAQQAQQAQRPQHPQPAHHQAPAQNARLSTNSYAELLGGKGGPNCSIPTTD